MGICHLYPLMGTCHLYPLIRQVSNALLFFHVTACLAVTKQPVIKKTLKKSSVELRAQV